MSETLFVGIDPGKMGAIAILSDPVKVIPTPILVGGTKRVISKKTGKPSTRKLATDQFDVKGFAVLIWDLLNFGVITKKPKVHVCFEETKTLPGAIVKDGKLIQAGGGKANFSRGYSLGMIEGILSAVQHVRPGLTFQSVRPQTWMKPLHGDLGGGDTKMKSVIVARRLFPLVSLRRTARSRKDDDGFADALLIAEYGRRTNFCGAPMVYGSHLSLGTRS